MFIVISILYSEWFSKEKNIMKIFITGASKGIGLFLLRKFIIDGYAVCGTYSSTLPLEEFEANFTKVNIGSTEEVNDWIKKSADENSEIVLINCAGTNYNAIARKADVDRWKELIDINLIGIFRTINAVLPLMYEKGFGRIINFSSILAQKGVAGTSAYAASKSALWGMTKTIAVENAKHNITVNNINLGYFEIGMTLSDVPELLQIEMKKQIPSNKFGNPEEIYKTVRYLIESDYITGTSIDLNGGLY